MLRKILLHNAGVVVLLNNIPLMYIINFALNGSILLFQSVKLISDRNPNYANCLKETLEKNEALWNELKTTVAVQGSKLIKEYRGIVS